MPDDKYEKLKKLLPDDLKKGLLPAEDGLLKKVVIGDPLDLLSYDDEEDDPKNANNWDESRSIRAGFLRWLCTDNTANPLIHSKGIRIQGARIKGDLDFEGATLPHPLFLFKSKISKLILRDATTRTINLSGSHTGHVNADGLNVEGSLFLRDGFVAEGTVSLLRATIKGDLSCRMSTFKNKDSDALRADGITIDGNIFLSSDFSAEGAVTLVGATIKGDLSCKNGTFKNKDGNALSADKITVNGGIFFNDGFSAEGAVRLLRATIRGDLTCRDGIFNNKGGNALNADGITVKGGIFLDKDFSAKGNVSLLGATIKGNLMCRNGTFKNKDGMALNAERIKVEGGIVLDYGFSAEGEIRLLGATIKGDLDCNEGIFRNITGTALDARRMDVGGAFIWQTKEKPKGDINLQHAKVAQMEDAMESWPLQGKLHIDGFEYSSLSGYSTQLSPEERLHWINLQYPEAYQPDTEPIENKEPIMRYWPFSWFRSKYNKIIKSLPSRIYIPPKNAKYRPQPYEQLAKVLRAMGHENDARDIYIAKQEALRKNVDISPRKRFWYWFLFHTIEHGWKVSKVIKWYVLPTIVFGSIVFFFADYLELMVQSKATFFSKPKTEYPGFNAIIYSLDSFVPFLNLHQEDYFSIHPHSFLQKFFKLYLWAHIIAGWVFSTLAAVALSGLKRKE